MHPEQLKFDKKFLQDLWNLLKPYWVSEEKKLAWVLLFLLMLCVVCEVTAGIGFNYFYKFFYDALQSFDTHKIINSFYYFVAVRALFTAAVAATVFLSGTLSIRWQRWLTQYYLHRWLQEHTHYRLQFLSQKIDNPDQRITEDLQKFTELTLRLLFGPYMLIQQLLYLVSFSVILWNLSKNFPLQIGRHSFLIPGYLLWIALFYGAFGVVVIVQLGKKLSFLDYLQQRLNADFRFSLIRMRESSEQVSFSRGEPMENKKFRYFFNLIFHNFLNIVSLNTRLAFFNRCYDYLSYAIGFAVCIPAYLGKLVGLGMVMQTSSAYSFVVGSISLFLEEFQSFSDWRSVIYRLTEFRHSMESLPTSVEQKIIIRKQEVPFILVSNLQLAWPDGKKLPRNIQWKIALGEKILLQGPSGSGKSTLLRAMAGIWMYGTGEIILPKNASILFLPQKTYFPLGSFKELLSYPHDSNEEERIDEVLKLCLLEKFKPYLHDEKSWTHQLSLGEQQLLAFARIFYAKPDILFLDEATASLDEATEFQLYENLKLFLPKVTLISVGHRKTLLQFHEKVVDLDQLSSNNRIHEY
ncbi:MAG: ABC transporter ATP-binding protein/permease [Chthoniobacterales bacterium]